MDHDEATRLFLEERWAARAGDRTQRRLLVGPDHAGPSDRTPSNDDIAEPTGALNADGVPLFQYEGDEPAPIKQMTPGDYAIPRLPKGPEGGVKFEKDLGGLTPRSLHYLSPGLRYRVWEPTDRRPLTPPGFAGVEAYIPWRCYGYGLWVLVTPSTAPRPTRTGAKREVMNHYGRQDSYGSRVDQLESYAMSSWPKYREDFYLLALGPKHYTNPQTVEVVRNICGTGHFPMGVAHLRTYLGLPDPNA